MSSPAEGKAAAGALLLREPRPTAILALSDQLAFGLVEAAGQTRLSVTEDLSVVGFDEVPEATRSTPPLTTLRQPHVKKGLQAGRKLVARLREEDPGGQQEIVLPTSSCAVRRRGSRRSRSRASAHHARTAPPSLL